MGVKITALEVENLKRVKAVALDVGSRPLTVIGGRNGQGKTSCIDAIAWALGGDRFRPSQAVHDGAEEAYIKVELDNGITVERKGVNGALKVTGAKGGQSLLNEFVNQFALNLPKFMAATDLDRAKMLLDVFPDLGPKIQKFNVEIKAKYDERHALGVIADRKAKFAAELPFDSTAPEKPLSGNEMAKRMQDALSVNAGNQAKRQNAAKAADEVKSKAYRVESAEKRIADLKASLAQAQADLDRAQSELNLAKEAADLAQRTAAELRDLDTSAIEQELEQIDATNARVRANESKRNAEDEAATLKEQYAELSTAIDKMREERTALLASVKMPLDGLGIDEDGALVYRGQKWDCMSGSEQLRVATAICAAVNPKCGFVLLDKLEAMDTQTLAEFGDWLESRGLQAIGTRVGTGDECSIVIEDGTVVSSSDFKF